MPTGSGQYADPANRRSATPTHYDTLGIPATATAAELRRAYLQRARKLHPDQYSDRSDGERRKAERRMQDLNAAWNVLSDPAARRKYDLEQSRRTSRPTGPPTTSASAHARSDPEVRPRRAPQVASEEDMEIRGFARLIRPGPIVALIIGIFVLVVVAGLISSDDEPTPNRSTAPVAQPTGTPLGCIDIVPRAVEVPCGDHEGIVWATVEAGESCPDGLEAFYREGLGGLFCATRVD